MDRIDRIHNNMKVVFNEIKDGKIKDSEKLDERLSSFKLMRVPLQDYKEVRKHKLKGVESKTESLRRKRTDYYLSILGIITGIFGTALSINNTMSWLFILSSIITALFLVRLITKINKEAASNEVLAKYWYPYIIVEGNIELRRKLISQGVMEP